ncbi:MAG: hypothetical protein A2X34_08830 [Elusimicrobia bacterium GWC2_51_8]|nr:MAG: hypothetical protein A2X33_10580 [Elusimicrobia bacterium GWA2_51_34]OGR59994.1 MAG: hypothetical protein A2X34_08830 [Elusimicrobia bacterium GWC2_51_8]OGR86318.1 MAG: hypothetical protein A2021_06760 [Elusimicrobia bacterium GWF2_52_66]HAF95181.1 hypothetical protein [Elusimicrobiota bacterium]HCE98391.1 hypothetical protein [Elusimicrobiota bacterium]
MTSYYSKLRQLIIGLNKLSKSHKEIEKALVMLCLQENGIYSIKNKTISLFIKGTSKTLVASIHKLCIQLALEINESLLTDVLEQFISKGVKRQNGTVFTPKPIKEFILSQVLPPINIDAGTPTICDPSCGSGSFLISAAILLHAKHKIPFSHIYSNILFGVDLMPQNIQRAALLMSLVALLHGEDREEFSFNLSTGDALSLNWQETFKSPFRYGGFDAIIGNPPYVRAKNIGRKVKKSLKKWETAATGNPDLYIPFFELGLTLIRPGGALGYISINSYLHSLNGRALRGYLSLNRFQMKIANFEGQQIFDGVLSYTCVTIIRKHIATGVEYAEPKNATTITNTTWNTIPYSELNDKTGWTLAPVDIWMNLKKIESVGATLGALCPIRNGIATLNNELYIFKPTGSDNSCYFRVFEGKTYKIEKAICRDIIKPNILHSESDILRFKQKAIFPYKKTGSKFTVIGEQDLAHRFPNCYAFLKVFKTRLSLRDKGKKEYPTWYAFGRTQGFSIKGKKIFIPYMSDKPNAIICKDEDLMFYCGYAIIINDEEQLQIIKKILNSDVFWYYIKNTSKHYSSGYMSLAKNYIAKFSIPDFTMDQRDLLLKSKDPAVINDTLQKAFNLNLYPTKTLTKKIRYIKIGLKTNIHSLICADKG